MGISGYPGNWEDREVPAGAVVPAAPTVSGENLEKPNLTIGFLPITCATPIVMAHAGGFYKKYGLNVTVKKFGGWADVRDAFIAGEIDAAHMLSPMPLALSLGLGSARVPTRLAVMENVNGSAITLANKHKDKVRGPQDMKGMVLAIPFDYSNHNLMLRHYLMSGGVDPDKDVQLRVMRPPDMVANLASGNIDGYVVAEPFNQRAVHEKVGYIHLLSKEIWPSHPCCAFAAKEEFVEKYPKTYRALVKAIVDASHYSRAAENRAKVAAALAPKEYLNQPEDVLKAVMTGVFDNGKGQTLQVPDRIDFDPYPWKSAAVWIETQLIRWNYIKGPEAGNLDLKQVADRVFATNDVVDALKALGLPYPSEQYKVEQILGKPFDPNHYQPWLVRQIN